MINDKYLRCRNRKEGSASGPFKLGFYPTQRGDGVGWGMGVLVIPVGMELARTKGRVELGACAAVNVYHEKVKKREKLRKLGSFFLLQNPILVKKNVYCNFAKKNWGLLTQRRDLYEKKTCFWMKKI